MTALPVTIAEQMLAALRPAKVQRESRAGLTPGTEGQYEVRDGKF